MASNLMAMTSNHVSLRGLNIALADLHAIEQLGGLAVEEKKALDLVFFFGQMFRTTGLLPIEILEMRQDFLHLLHLNISIEIAPSSGLVLPNDATRS